MAIAKAITQLVVAVLGLPMLSTDGLPTDGVCTLEYDQLNSHESSDQAWLGCQHRRLGRT